MIGSYLHGIYPSFLITTAEWQLELSCKGLRL